METQYNKRHFLFFSGPSSSGKSFFIKNFLPTGAFYKLISATTREIRPLDNEVDGRDYYFRDEAYFEKEKFATYLWVNEAFWKPGVPKWLYGVPEFEIINNLGCNFAYDVIQPRYIREMIDWFHKTEIKGLKLSDIYDFRILWFQPPQNSSEIVQKRQNMPNDVDVRRKNTCNLDDFKAVGLEPDHRVICNPAQVYIDSKLRAFLDSFTNTK